MRKANFLTGDKACKATQMCAALLGRHWLAYHSMNIVHVSDFSRARSKHIFFSAWCLNRTEFLPKPDFKERTRIPSRGNCNFSNCSTLLRVRERDRGGRGRGKGGGRRKSLFSVLTTTLDGFLYHMVESSNRSFTLKALPVRLAHQTRGPPSSRSIALYRNFGTIVDRW